MNRINRRYYSFDMELVSPLSLGSGLNENTDADVLLDSRGVPYIPATSIAGVLASRLQPVDKEILYGKIAKSDSSKDENQKSHVVFYDAVCSKKSIVSVRDSVALKEKVAKKGSKFDFEIVEPGIVFKLYIELDDHVTASDEELVLEQLNCLNEGILRFGRKTTRGYGQVKLNNGKKMEFSEVEKWLDFDMYDENSWDRAKSVGLSEINPETDVINLKLRLKGALSIRSYTTELPKTEKDAAPDYKYLSLNNGSPVIPGTSWAGAFRERFKQFAGTKNSEELFGFVKEAPSKARRSWITFSESRLKDYEEKKITRNSIDRFTAAVNDGALYTELTVFGGNTDLTITIPAEIDEKNKMALLAVIADLHNGFMAVGGLTSVGRGLFEVERLKYNGEDRTEYFKSYNFSAVLGEEGEHE